MNKPIGVFDSGLGGLTVVKQLMRQLPQEDIVYFGDTARVPYGTKSKESIIRFSQDNVKVLLKHKVKLIVVACNSSSSYALPLLRKRYRLPIVDVIAPGANKVVEVTKNNKVGVIATSATIQSQSYQKAIRKRSKTIKAYTQECPLFVPLVEEGWANKSLTQDIAREYLKGIKKSGIDALILGCTHYPLLKNTLTKVMGKKVTLVDSAQEVATAVKQVLREEGLLTIKKRKGRCTFLVSDKPQKFHAIAKKFLGFEMKHVRGIHNV